MALKNRIELPAWKEDLNTQHRTIRARVEPTAPSFCRSVRFSHGLLDAVDGEDIGPVVKVAAGVGDVRASREPEGTHR